MKDLEQVRDRELKERVRKVIERLEGADMLQEVEGGSGCKAVRGITGYG